HGPAFARVERARIAGHEAIPEGDHLEDPSIWEVTDTRFEEGGWTAVHHVLRDRSEPVPEYPMAGRAEGLEVDARDFEFGAGDPLGHVGAQRPVRGARVWGWGRGGGWCKRDHALRGLLVARAVAKERGRPHGTAALLGHHALEAPVTGAGDEQHAHEARRSACLGHGLPQRTTRSGC